MWAAGQYLYLLVVHPQLHQIACAQHVILHAGYLFHYFRSEGWVFAVNGRAYLLPASGQNIYDFGANAEAVPQEILIDPAALKELGCDYIFSRVEITNADEMQLCYIKEYKDYEMPYSVYLYVLQ